MSCRGLNRILWMSHASSSGRLRGRPLAAKAEFAVCPGADEQQHKAGFDYFVNQEPVRSMAYFTM